MVLPARNGADARIAGGSASRRPVRLSAPRFEIADPDAT
jgi:hypothetical protein